MVQSKKIFKKMKQSRIINKLTKIAAAAGISAALGACDATIHEYPKPFHSAIVIQANIDHTGPYDYKELLLDDEGKATINKLEENLSSQIKPGADWKIRVTYEIRKRTDDDRLGEIIERRVKYTTKNGDLTQDTIHTVLSDGKYEVGVFADYVAVSPSTPIYQTDLLEAIKMDYNRPVTEPLLKSCAVGRTPFNIDFNLSQEGYPTFGEHLTSLPAFNQLKTVPVDLKHPTARFKIITTDYDLFSKSLAGDDAKIYTKLGYKGFIAVGLNSYTDLPNDIIKGYLTQSEPVIVRAYAKTRTEEGTVEEKETEEKCIFMDYVFTNPQGEDHITIDFDIIDANGKVLNKIRDLSVPLLRNHETIIRGKFLTRPYKGKNNGISIDENFNGEYVIHAEN